MTATVGPRRLRAMSGAIDQAFSSVSNGVIVFAVAVASSPKAFGHITILMTLLIAVLTCLRGGLGVPLLQKANQPVDEIRRGGALSVASALAISPVLIVAMLCFFPLVGWSAVALAVFAPFVLGQDLLRYVAMTIGRPHIAAIWDGVWCLGAVIALLCAWLHLPFVNAASVLASWGFLAMVAFVAMAFSLRVVPTLRGLVPWLKSDWQHRIRYTVDAGLEQTSMLVVFVLVTALITADATGALRGAMALFAPVGIMGAAVQIILIPESVRASASPARVWQVLTKLAILTASLALVIGVICYFLPPSLGFYVLGDTFDSTQAVIVPSTAWFIAACLPVVQSLFWRTFNLSSRALTAKVWYTITQLLVTLVVAWLVGTAAGVAWGIAIQSVLIAMFFLFLWKPWSLEVADADAPDVVLEDPVSPVDPPLAVDLPHTERPPLSEGALRDAVVGPGLPWRRLDVVDETGSTNADMLDRARSGEDIDGAVLIAEHQSAGRGRLGRNWVAAPRAQLALSAGADASAVPTDRWGWLPLVTGLAVADAVAEVAGVDARLKWPNDVLVGDAKLAGILAEVASPESVVVVGIGLNVTLTKQESGQPNATSLLELGVEHPDRDRLARALLLRLGERVADWRAGKEGLAADYRDRSATIGAQVKVMLPGEQEIIGTAVSVDDQGRLVVESNGEHHAVSAGDVVHLRPA